MYTSLKSIPELSRLSASARRHAWYSCVMETYRHWQVIIPLVTGVLAPFLLMIFMYDGSSWEKVVLAIWLLIGVWFYHQMQCKYIRPCLRRFIGGETT